MGEQNATTCLTACSRGKSWTWPSCSRRHRDLQLSAGNSATRVCSRLIANILPKAIRTTTRLRCGSANNPKFTACALRILENTTVPENDSNSASPYRMLPANL